jgi:MOSC domain-containing protein YiiM
VTREGQVAAGDAISLIDRDPNAVTVSEITRLYIAKSYSDSDVASLRRALKVDALPASWKDYFRDRLQKTNA